MIKICKYCIKDFKTRYGTRKFCSYQCYWDYMVGKKQNKNISAEKNPNWKGGKIMDSDGYVLIYCPYHHCPRNQYVLEHRLVMEKHIGRYLNLNEVVHHINNIKHDNRIENLYLMTKQEHDLLRHKDLVEVI